MSEPLDWAAGLAEHYAEEERALNEEAYERELELEQEPIREYHRGELRQIKF